MELDAEALVEGARLEAELCIVGAGPAGIALASEYSQHGQSVLLLESGGPGPEIWPQSLNEGTVTANSYLGLRATRHRQAGGTSHLWNTPVGGRQGAKYVPLDPWDMAEWPIGWQELLPYYHRAQRMAGLGPFRYEGTDWPAQDRPALEFENGLLATRVYQFGSLDAFTRTRLAAIRGAPNVRLCYHATVCALSVSPDGARVTGATVRCRSGREIAVRSPRYVLAAGAIENARLLLSSGLGNRFDWVGRCFMEHPRDQSLTLLAAGPDLFRRLAFYDQHTSAAGAVVGGRLGPTEPAIREHRLANFSITFLPSRRDRPPPRGLGGRITRRIGAIVAPPPAAGYGWSRLSGWLRWFEGFRMLLNLEQRPHPENRLVLGGETDALGIPRARLRWTWRPEEQAALDRLHALLPEWLGDAALGTVRRDAGRAPDPNAHHHAGTTRMSQDARDGVVDPACRVHDLENLYLTGASVFPTAGFANPTLTIVALAIRLADHLRGKAPDGELEPAP